MGENNILNHCIWKESTGAFHGCTETNVLK